MQGLNFIPTAFILSGLTSWNLVPEELRVLQLMKECLAFMGRGTRLPSAGVQQRFN